jgi:hypothetical protein
MLEVVKDDVQQQPAFDPTKKYTWSMDTEFVLKGSEFGLVLNALRSIVSTPEAQSIFLANKAVEMIENTLGKAIEDGSVQEVIENKASL